MSSRERHLIDRPVTEGTAPTDPGGCLWVRVTLTHARRRVTTGYFLDGLVMVREKQPAFHGTTERYDMLDLMDAPRALVQAAPRFHAPTLDRLAETLRGARAEQMAHDALAHYRARHAAAEDQEAAR